VQPSGADQAATTLGKVDGEIGELTISDPPTQAEVQALLEACEELADDVRALATLVHALRRALVGVWALKGGT
jgi:anti-sigma factor RsiW